jgi:cytochrome c-type biogenesis protein
VVGVAGGLAAVTGVSAWAARGLPIAQLPWSLLPAGLLLLAGLFTLELLPAMPAMLGRFGRGIPAMTGLALGVGWTPCNTPSMALGLMAASHSESWGFALALIGAYVSGVVVPVAGMLLGLTRISRLRRGLQRAGRGIQITSGLSLIVLAALVGTGMWQSVTASLALLGTI